MIVTSRAGVGLLVAVAVTPMVLTLSACDSTGVDRANSTSTSSTASTSSTSSVASTTTTTGVVFGETTIVVGEQRLRVQVADTQAERALGLMYRETLDSYDGMLFIFEDDSIAGFTMSRTIIPLTIGFYEADGDRVTKLDMTPCDDEPRSCPVYKSARPYRYALEVASGRLPSGRLVI